MTAASNLKRIPLQSSQATSEQPTSESSRRKVKGAGLQVSSSNLHRTKRSSLGVWEYPPGEFEWRADADHSACVIEGSARVELCDGRTLQLEPGMTLYLPRGMGGRWAVQSTLRTVALNNVY